MRIVLFGPPASGKGTQASFLHEALNVPHVSTGDLLRRVAKEDNSLGEQVRAVPTGFFASDELMIEILKEELKKPDYSNGVVLDGFPRTVSQAEKMQEMGLNMDIAIDIRVDEKALMERIVNRVIHPASGRSYNLISNPPKKAGFDDLTQEPLVQRKDDKAELVAQRMADYHAKTQPAVEAFRSMPGVFWLRVDGMRDPSEVFSDIEAGFLAVRKVKQLCPLSAGTLIFEGNHPELMLDQSISNGSKPRKPK